MRVRRFIAAALAAAGIAVFAAGPAFADQPGPGDKQCIPGQQGNPQPGFKAGVCDNPG
jgi:hypothetical protein